MPKLVDHDQRRAELARVVWEVIGRDGIEAATVRRIAEEAGLSIGGLRHYFDSQRGLLRFAAEAVGRSVGARVTELLRADLSGVDRARALLAEMLPLDADRRVEADVWLACLVRARTDASMGDLRGIAWAGERHICRLAVAFRCDARPPEVVGDELQDPSLERQARRLHVFLDGLTLQAATYPGELSTGEALDLLGAELDLIAELVAAPAD
ncbi:TetR/AcrR family transcriptional regulator [Streptoalloteichus hindustanus]|uniref:Transcriptional regulator, TetR family n=1 Tax=Streptoalloteichus hindustanus TaxID=2017 RepID=A0A1M5PHM1_STRHI|nr:TetR/AcrR family transcriptional regulator [Streptoalloteichus hindustanus]SHH01296.1 transcriptional regulator, TetR family [Streptoalloteichus hindustanus]